MTVTGNLDAAVNAIRSATNVIYLTGAGISVASGIAPYRKSREAVWSRFHTDWGTTHAFESRTLEWWTQFWKPTRANIAVDRHPNAAHHALVRLASAGAGHTVITQNIDGLHLKAGHPAQQVVEVHGRTGLFRCVEPGCVHFSRELLPPFDDAMLDRGEIPLCPTCGAKIRPLVLLFDEIYLSHPFFQWPRTQRLLEQAEVIVFAGTSFSVGITTMALEQVHHRRIPAYNFNIEPVPGLTNVRGPCEETLVQLAGLITP